EETQTATITFKGNTVGLGETGTSEVVLTYKDGVSATSTNSVQTPKLDNVTIEVTDNQDGSYTYTMNGMGVDPSIGNVEVNVLALTDVNNLSINPVTQTYIEDSANFTQVFTSHVDAYGETLTAVVEVELIWSLDELAIGQFMMDEVEYRIEDISELTFTDVTNVEGYAYSYTVNAKFANLLNATPVSMDIYSQTYNTLFDEVYEEELITTLDASQITKEDNGNITASYINEDQLLGTEQDGHTWRIVLTYVDATNTTQTMEISNHIEAFDPVFNHLNSIMWQENGITYAEYEQVFSLSPTLTLKDVALVNANVSGWEILSSEVEITDTFGYIRGLMSSDSQSGLELHAYLDWLATADYEEMIYTGCGGAGYLESSRTNQQLVPNSTNTGYDEAIEEFTFVDGTSLLDDYGQQHVLVTLADGSQIKVTQTEADATGTVTVNWNDNNNIVVTVNQANVAIGQSTVVDFVYERVRDEPEMMGEVNHYTYRCFSNYE
ncbi:MAG: hypothetical protein IJO78_05250, partial [Erysipelotrichaceae bacterium]|nr:hypothetical protein [Erysipelotrichaceae bacterium]